MPYNFKKAYYGANASRKRANTVALARSAYKAYNGANAARKRANTAKTFKQVGGYIRRYAPIAATISGMGDYTVRPRSSSASKGYYRAGMHGFAKAHREGGSMGSHGHIPRVHLEKGTMRISHTEYIGILVSSATTGSSNFVSQSYAINPGNSGTFPWLSSTAINFQEYKFNKLVFEYRPLTSESTATTAATLTSMGSVGMATQYNSVLGPYTNYQGMAESDYAVTIKPCEHALHAIECNARYNPIGIQYVSAQTSLTVGANNSDIRMQNLGIFTIASNNIPIAASTALSLGEIWVTYDIILEKPQINAYLSGLLSAHYYGDAATGSPTTTTPFGANITALIQPLSSPNNLLGLSFATAGNAFSFPLQVTSGQYFILYWCKGTLAATASTTPTIANGSFVMVGNNGTLGTEQLLNWEQAGNSSSTNGTVTVNAYAQWMIIQVNAPGAALCTVTLNTSVVPTTSGWDLYVTPYNSLMV